MHRRGNPRHLCPSLEAGLKCVAIYRDGSKRSQPLNTKKTNEGGGKTFPDNSAWEGKIAELEAEVSKLRADSGKPLRAG